MAPVGITIPGGPDGASRVRSLKLDIFLLSLSLRINRRGSSLECGDWSPPRRGAGFPTCPCVAPTKNETGRLECLRNGTDKPSPLMLRFRHAKPRLRTNVELPTSNAEFLRRSTLSLRCSTFSWSEGCRGCSAAKHRRVKRHEDSSHVSTPLTCGCGHPISSGGEVRRWRARDAHRGFPLVQPRPHKRRCDKFQPSRGRPILDFPAGLPYSLIHDTR